MERRFSGIAHARDFEGGRAVELRLTDDAIVASNADGLTLSVPYSDCQIERGGANGRQWFCHRSDRSVSLMTGDSDFIEALRAGAGPQLAGAIDALVARSRRADRSATLRWGIVFAIVVAALLGVTVGLRQAAKSAVDALPPSVDTRLGEMAWQSMSARSRRLEDADVSAALRKVVDRLAGTDEHAFDYQLHVVNEPIENAFALPGGVLVVYTGLIREAESPEQLAGVIAHEMAHVQRRHGMRRVAQSLGVVAALQLVVGDVSGLAGVAVEVLREGTINSYSRDQEREADLDAVNMLARAGIDPRGLAEFLDGLRRKQAGAPSMPEWLSTHPDLSTRVAELREAAARTRGREIRPLDVDWQEIQRRVQEAPPPVPAGKTPLIATRD